ncbi:MAG: carboxypeptidase-like regulatory domain-containing protein [Candidatus Marinimicrobia bacterium]|nr:carboxypeptidase-like regulatory domain-containing protein [Candidatus Neomarinimicrobiota bacterium]
MKIKSSLLFMFIKKSTFLVFLCSFLWADNNTITGYVEDQRAHNVLKNVNITLKNTDFGTTTDANGFFEMDISGFQDSQVIVFSHVGYFDREMTLSDCKKYRTIQLTPTEIRFGEIKVEATQEASYTREISNEITILHEKEFSSGGYLDAADLIVTKNSIMVDESLSGRKTISVRGANADETVVLLDGIKVNSSFNNIFDLSLLNTSTLSQVDIIHGGNLATFDGIGSAAVINFIPKLEQDYLARFYQRFGSYNSGDWGLNFYKQLWNLQVFASMNEGASQLYYIEDPMDAGSDKDFIDRTHSNITINSKSTFFIRKTENAIKANYIQSNRDYLNHAYHDSLDKSQSLFTLKYDGDYLKYGKMSLALASNKETEDHAFRLNNYQDIENDDQIFQSEYILPINAADVFVGFKTDKIISDLKEKILYLEQNHSQLTRKSSDLSAGFKIENNKVLGHLDLRSLGFNFNYKMIADEGDSAYAINGKFNQSKSSYMVSSVFGNENESMLLRVHVNYANDFRLPTPYQLLLSHHYQSKIENSGPFLMENKRSTEIGIDVKSNHNAPMNWSFTGIFFSNAYNNKYREIQLSGSPITFLDHYKDAEIKGIEGKVDLSFLQNKIKTQFNYNKNMIDDKAAFPFKLESKATINAMLLFNHLTINVTGFRESERTGIIYDPEQGLKEIKLEPFANVDFHMEGNFNLWRTNWSCAFSARNLLGGELLQEGIAIRDRRYYITFGVEVK